MDLKRPGLSVAWTAEDDDSQVSTPSSTSVVDRKAIAYLLRYETMVRQQEAEHMATLAHLRPFLEHHLSGDIDDADSVEASLVKEDADFLEKEISFKQIQRALKELQNSPHAYMRTDRQLIMVLKTMTQKVKRNHAAMIDGIAESEVKDVECESITWGEFLQCYKTVISGMQTLKHVTEPTNRGRVKDRTLSMISLFEPPATKLLGIPREVDVLDTSNDGTLNTLQTYKPTAHKRFSQAHMTRKKFIYALMGALFGASVAISVNFMHPEMLGHNNQNVMAAPPLPNGKPLAPTPIPECKRTIEYVEKKIYVPVESAKPTATSIFQPAAPPHRTAAPAATQSLDSRQKLALPKASTAAQHNKNLYQQQAPLMTTSNHIALSAAVGGTAGMMAAPLIWTAFQKIPLIVAGPGGWGLATVAGVAVLHGLFHSLSGMLRAVTNRSRRGKDN